MRIIVSNDTILDGCSHESLLSVYLTGFIMPEADTPQAYSINLIFYLLNLVYPVHPVKFVFSFFHKTFDTTLYAGILYSFHTILYPGQYNPGESFRHRIYELQVLFSIN
jgi:hypothetical protein